MYCAAWHVPSLHCSAIPLAPSTPPRPTQPGQVYASLPLLYTADCECSKVRWYLRLSCREEAAVDGSDGGWFTSSALLSVMRSGWVGLRWTCDGTDAEAGADLSRRTVMDSGPLAVCNSHQPCTYTHTHSHTHSLSHSPTHLLTLIHIPTSHSLTHSHSHSKCYITEHRWFYQGDPFL